MTEEKLKIKNSFYFSIIGIAIFIFLVVMGLYFFNFKEFGLSPDQNIWGVFGDFMGGTLNPIFALLSFIALLVTIKIQSDELRLTREELKKSSTALVEQSKSFKIQNNSIKQQNFENTFFKMIDLHNEIVNNLILKPLYTKTIQKRKVTSVEYFFMIGQDTKIDNHDNGTFKSKQAISRLIYLFEYYFNKKYAGGMNIDEIYNNFHTTFQNDIGHYFGHIYQVLKFIDESYINDKERYSNLYRALFSKDELELLSYHCIGEIGSRKFKKYIETFHFFEHLTSNIRIDIVKPMYKESAFKDE